MLIYFGLFRHLLFNGTVSYLSFYAEFDLLDDMFVFFKKKHTNTNTILTMFSILDHILTTSQLICLRHILSYELKKL